MVVCVGVDDGGWRSRWWWVGKLMVVGEGVDGGVDGSWWRSGRGVDGDGWRSGW